MRVLPCTAGFLLLASSLSAQGTCKPSADSHEAEAFRHMAVPMAFSQGQAPWAFPPGGILLGLEVTGLPDMSDATATPSKCRPGTGPDNWNLVGVIPRVRFGFSMSDATVLEVSWTPPVRMAEVKPNLWSFAVSRTVPFNKKGLLMTGRLHATIGSILAPITCPKSAVNDPTDPVCYKGQVSDDKFAPNIYGGELLFGLDLANGHVRPYGGGGYSIVHPRFEQSGEDSLGNNLKQKVEVNTHQWILNAGLTWAVSSRLMLSGEAYSAPADLLTWRARATYLFGGKKKGR